MTDLTMERHNKLLLQWIVKPIECTKKAIEPPHYQGKTIQVFDVLDEFLTEEEVGGFYTGNVIKYVLRHKAKGGKEDLMKAKAYLDKLIEVVK